MANQAKFEKAVQLLKSEDYKGALNLLTELVKEFPENADYYSERGVVFFHVRKKKEAIKDMDKAVELEPHKSYRYSSRAYILGHYGKTEAAITDYEKAIELDPEDAIAHNNLGLLQEQQGYKNKAKTNFTKADSLAGNNTDTGRADLNIEGEDIQTRNIQKEIDEENKNKSLYSELKGILSKEGRESFGRFIKSGFKKT